MEEEFDWDDDGDEGRKSTTSRSLLVFIASALTSLLIFIEFNTFDFGGRIEFEDRVVGGTIVSMPVEVPKTGPAALLESAREQVAEYVPLLRPEPVADPLLRTDHQGVIAILGSIARRKGLNEEGSRAFMERWLSGEPFSFYGEEYGLRHTAKMYMTHAGESFNIAALDLFAFRGGYGRVIHDDYGLVISASGELVRVGPKGRAIKVITDDAYRGGQGWIGNDMGYGEALAWIYTPTRREGGVSVVGTLNEYSWFWIEARLQHLGPKSSQWFPQTDPVVLRRPAKVDLEGDWGELVGESIHEPIGMISAETLIMRASKGKSHGLWSVDVFTGETALLETWSSRPADPQGG